MVVRTCVWCGVTFETFFKKAKACGEVCRDARANLKKNERKKRAKDPEGYRAAQLRGEAAKDLSMRQVDESFGETFAHLERSL